MLCGLQHRGHEREGGLPEKEAGPPVTRVSLGETWGVGNGFPGALGTAAGAVAGSGTQAAPVVVVGGHERAAGGDGRHALACWLVGPAHGGRGAPRISGIPSGRALPSGWSRHAGFFTEAGLPSSRDRLRCAGRGRLQPARTGREGGTKALCAQGTGPDARNLVGAVPTRPTREEPARDPAPSAC